MNKSFFSIAVILMLASAFFFGCNKSADAGIGIIPEDKLIHLESSDTIDIEAYTYPIDSIVTSNVSSVLLGSYDDPVFGKVKAGFVIQITPGATSGFGANPVADSIVLSLRYASDSLIPQYGEQGATMNFIAQEINTQLYRDSSYYNTYKPEWLNLSDELVNTTFIPEDGRNDTVVLDVPLNQAFGQKIIDNYEFWHDDVEPTDTSFYDFFQGMYIKSNDIPYNGSISTFSILDNYSKAVLYYHNDDDTLELSFSISQYSTRFNMYSHLHDAPGFLPDLNNPGEVQDSVVYMQGMGGLKVKIEIPGLDELKKSGLWGVNRAELVLPVVEDKLLTYENEYPVPLKANILGVTNEGGLQFLDDYLGETGYLGVNYSDNKYIFDITYRVQQILSGSIENNGFFLFPGTDYINPSRVVLTGPEHSNRMKLILSLRKID
ncbi:MAG: DUF4270 family protein [Bacteroidota bacterium]